MTEYVFQLRRGTTAQWAASSRILRPGEPGLDTELGIEKRGDGVHLWADLPAVVDMAKIAAAPELSNAFAGIDLRTAAVMHSQIPDWVQRRSLDLYLNATEMAALDKTGGTNVGPLLQKALDQAEAELAFVGPAQIVLPEGRFRFDAALNVLYKKNVGIAGAGRGVTTLLPYGRNSGFTGWEAPGAWNGTSYHEDLFFSDFTLDCSNQSHTAYDFSVKGFFIQHLKRCYFLRIHIKNSWATGLGIDFLQECYIGECIFSGAGRGVPSSRNGTGAGCGIGMGATEYETFLTFGCWSYNNYTHGFFIEHLDRPEAVWYSKGAVFSDCHAWGNWNGFLDAGGCGARWQFGSLTRNLFAGFASRGTGTGLQGGYDGVVFGAVITGNGASGGGGAVLSDTSAGNYLLAYCDINDNLGPGIWAPSTAKIGPGLRIEWNQIRRNNGPGILFEAAQAVLLSVLYNWVVGNVGDGMQFAGNAARAEISHNHSHRNGGRGLAFVGTKYAARPRVEQNDLTDNTGVSLVNEHTFTTSDYVVGNLVDGTSTHLIADPGFESNITGTTSLNAALSRVNVGSDGAGGAYVMRVTYNGAGGTGYGGISASSTVAPGDYVRAQIRVRGIPVGRKFYPTLNLGPGGEQVIGARYIGNGGTQYVEIEGTVGAGRTTLRGGVYMDTDASIVTGEYFDIAIIDPIKIT